MFTDCRWMFLSCFLAVALLACADFDDATIDASPDERDAQAITGGKADELISPCHIKHILLLANDPATDDAHLIAEGVHHRAARNMAHYRGGSDGVVGTDGDRFFKTIADVDAVPYVGPVAMRQLAAIVDPYCTTGSLRQTKTLFSPTSYTDSHIDGVVELVDGAQTSIDLAIYRLSDHRVINALGEAADRGVRIRVLFDEANGDHLRTEGSTSARLEERGADVRYINRAMHHKFVIVDGPQTSLLEASQARLATGSANYAYWTATTYDDHTIVHRRDPALVLTMQREFNLLWQHSRNLGWNDALQYFETLFIEEEMIPANDDLEVFFTSHNFETTESTRWGPGFRPMPFADHVVTRLVDLIDEARFSIDVATRYLRSRPIAQALMRRVSENPDLHIRIYVDQGEYIDEKDHLAQQEAKADCLIEADGDENDTYDCLHSGLVFSYALHEADVPIRLKTYAYHWHPAYAAQMHHKYMIIDDTTVAAGSYNYSNNAERNSMENLIVYRAARYPDVVDAFIENFETIWTTGGPDERFETLVSNIISDDELQLVFDPAALTYQELTALRRLIADHCPGVDADPYRSAPQANRTCPLQ